MAIDLAQYQSVVQQEQMALAAVIKAYRRKVRRLESEFWLATTFGDSSVEGATLERSQRDHSFLEYTARLIRDPPRIPETFARLDGALSLANCWPTVCHSMRGEVRVGSGFADQMARCSALADYASAHHRYLFEEKRLDLLPNFIKQTEFWDSEHLEGEIARRENRRTSDCAVSRSYRLFTVDELSIDFDPCDLADRFADSLISALRKQIRNRSRTQSGQASVQQAVMAAVTACTTALELGQSSQELKAAFPASLHESIDRLFRTEVDKVLKGGLA